MTLREGKQPFGSAEVHRRSLIDRGTPRDTITGTAVNLFRSVLKNLPAVNFQMPHLRLGGVIRIEVVQGDQALIGCRESARVEAPAPVLLPISSLSRQVRTWQKSFILHQGRQLPCVSRPCSHFFTVFAGGGFTGSCGFLTAGRRLELSTAVLRSSVNFMIRAALLPRSPSK
jgi:hypothetical protein